MIWGPTLSELRARGLGADPNWRDPRWSPPKEAQPPKTCVICSREFPIKDGRKRVTCSTACAEQRARKAKYEASKRSYQKRRERDAMAKSQEAGA